MLGIVELFARKFEDVYVCEGDYHPHSLNLISGEDRPLGYIHTCHLLGMNYCVNYSVIMACTVLWIHSHLRLIRLEL